MSTPTAPGPRLTHLDHTGSTQDVVTAGAQSSPQDWPHLSAVWTLDQRGGRGRRDRAWVTPRGTSLALSVLLRPDQIHTALDRQHWSWITLLAAHALAEQLRASGLQAHVKWPNDVLAPDGRKLCGILAAVLPDASGLVLGLGLNLDFGPAGAPVPTATSLADWLPDWAGFRPGQDQDLPDDAITRARDLASAILTGIGQSLGTFAEQVPDRPVDGRHPAAAPILATLETIGRPVRATGVRGQDIEGIAVGLGAGGTLLIDTRPSDTSPPDTSTPGSSGPVTAPHGRMSQATVSASSEGAVVEISAADVVHLRPADPGR